MHKIYLPDMVQEFRTHNRLLERQQVKEICYACPKVILAEVYVLVYEFVNELSKSVFFQIQRQ